MLLFERFSLGSGYRKYFRVAPAVDETQRESVFRIRHQVYCEELQFEPERPDGMESDPYDHHSHHCLLTTREEPRKMVGCARVIMPRPDDPEAPLPFELACRDTIDRSIIDPERLPRNSIAEVSRLAVRRQFRRRKGEERQELPIQDTDFGESGQPRFPFIPIALYMGAVALARHHGVKTLFVLTEPRLAAHFGKLGVRIQQIGGGIEHRGLRVPSMMQVDDIIANMRFLVRPIWKIIEEEVESGYRDREIG